MKTSKQEAARLRLAAERDAHKKIVDAKYTFSFERDETTRNPALHALYVRSAMKHLQVARAASETLYEFSNCNAMEIGYAIETVIAKLVTTDAAFRDAAARLFLRQEVDPRDEE